MCSSDLYTNNIFISLCLCNALKKAISRIREFNPDFVVVPLGFDPARNDPTGSWLLDAADFRANGELIAGLDRPTVFIQEGGYRISSLSKNAFAFFSGVLGET